MSMKLLRVILKRAEIVRTWRKYIPQIVKAIKEILPNSEIYVFGSAAEDKLSGGSDIDILIISGNAPKKVSDKVKLILEIEDKAELPEYHPFEFHIINFNEKDYYFKHIARSRIRIN